MNPKIPIAGSYKFIDKAFKKYKQPRRGKWEINHIPPISVTNGVDNRLAPSIVMDYDDHKRVLSTGTKPASNKHRATQRKLIEEKGFEGYMEAFNLDVADIQKKFDNKYDKHIEQARKYIENKKDLIKTQLKFAENYPDLVQKTTKRKSLFEKLKLIGHLKRFLGD